MSSGAWAMVAATVLSLGSLLFLCTAMLRSIHNERSPERSI